MKINKRTYFPVWIFFLSLINFFSTKAYGVSFGNETLHYIISYKWGLIHKDAGDAILSSRLNGDRWTFTLTARTKPWVDNIFMVRDTLTAVVDKKDFKPISYTKVSHEGNKYGKDVISYFFTSGHVSGKCVRYREKNGSKSESSNALYATGPTFDMLSVFYYLRLLDYSKFNRGMVTKVNIFSGSKSERLTIHALGEEVIKLKDKSRRKAIHVRFNFTTGGRKKSSEDIDCWISSDASRIPLLLIGTLPLGQVKCYYVG